MTEETAIELIKEVAGLKATVEDIHKQLFGNGQPGVIKEYNRRLNSLEDTRSRAKGIMWFLGIITSTLAFIVGKHEVIK